MSYRTPLACALAALPLLGLDAWAAETSGDTRFSFALVGDAPYGSRGIEAFDRLVSEVNADVEVEFVIHVGDIKGSGDCSDALLAARLAQIETFRAPVIYTPGDNEWTDCHRFRFGGHDPLERLAFLRALFYPNPGQAISDAPFPVDTQHATPGYETFVENVTFRWRNVRLATLHVVGSNNGLVPWEGIDPNDADFAPRKDRLSEFEARQAAAIHWLDHVFSTAAEEQASAIVLAIHGNPRFSLPEGHTKRRGFDAFIARLGKHVEQSDIPVLLVHGDFHELMIDHPLAAGESDPGKFTRVQTFGSPNIGWVKVTVSGNQRMFELSPRPVARSP